MHRVGLPFWRVYAVSVTDLNRRRRTDGMADGVREEVGYRDKLLIKKSQIRTKFSAGTFETVAEGPGTAAGGTVRGRPPGCTGRCRGRGGGLTPLCGGLGVGGGDTVLEAGVAGPDACTNLEQNISCLKGQVIFFLAMNQSRILFHCHARKKMFFW